jgi:hypothetical protein
MNQEPEFPEKTKTVYNVWQGNSSCSSSILILARGFSPLSFSYLTGITLPISFSDPVN